MDNNFDYAMRYFELHAGQRMSTFNFFIILSALLTTALVATFDKQFSYPSMGYAVAVAMICVSLIFWKLDQRVRFLIKHAEEALILLEGKERLEDSTPKLFTFETKKTSHKTKDPWQGLFKAHMSYSQCFGVIYFLFAAIGFAGVLARFFIQVS